MIAEVFAKYSAMLWLLVIGPRSVIAYGRCIIHDHGYTTGIYDIATGVSVITLLVLP